LSLNELSVELLTDLHLDLDMDSVLWCQGEDPSGQVSPERQIELNHELLLESRDLLDTSILYDLFPLRHVGEQEIIFDEGANFRGRLLADRFGLAQEVALALCTIGGGIDEQVVRYREDGDEVRAVLLDGIGTAAVGELAEKAHEIIVREAKARGWQASAPFQPGQIDWPVEDHEVFFDLLPAEELGLTLDSNHLMVPSKSLSMAVGLGEEMLPLAMERACRYCPIADQCRFSRA
jgi:cobalamin-dependent methionine synthase I